MYFVSIYENGRIKPVGIALKGVAGKRENDGGGKSN
jgi:hypothetical protein